MPLHPQCAAVIEAGRTGKTAFDSSDAAEARALYSRSTDALAPAPAELPKVENRSIPGPAMPIPLRIYWPDAGAMSAPVLVYFHGGGWVFGDLDTHDALCRALAAETPCVVVSVDYRLAPEHKFPAGLVDCLAATNWVATNATELGVDPDRIAVGGDSAGGNLAAAVTQAIKAQGNLTLVYQLLIYPAVDFLADTLSLRENATGYLLTRDAIQWTMGQYLPAADDAVDPRASPLRAADFAGLPPALVITAEFDPLRDEGEDYANAIGRAGGQVEVRRYDGMVHGFMRMAGVIDDAKSAIAHAAASLRAAFTA
jgi:acetyl esterase